MAVQRFAMLVEQSLQRGLQWAVFEPNAEPLWAQVRLSVSNFMLAQWRNGALQGGKPDEALFFRLVLHRSNRPSLSSSGWCSISLPHDAPWRRATKAQPNPVGSQS